MENIESLFNYFVSNCIKDKNKFSSNELVGIFMGILTNKENYYIHPNNKNKLITLNKPIAVDGKVFQSIFSHFDDNLSWKQKKELIAISDRLIEDTERRFNGAFYTPSEFASYSQKMISSSLGDNWREEYVVWDCCSGLKNLTRDFTFNKLYCSTLEQNDIDLSACYNTNATSFQFDFLNDSLEKLPQSLIEHLNNNDKIIFYINPPYATACELSLDAGKSKKNVAKTRINEIMKENKVGASSQNLIAQFLYRILLIKKEFNLTNISVGCFTKPLLTTASTFKKLRDLWFKEFKFDRGILFNAGHFAGVSSKWGITFEIWKEGIQEERNCFLMYIVDSKDGEVYPICSKVMYNTDGIKLASDWTKEPMKGVKTHKNHLVVSSGTKPYTSVNRASNYPNNFGYFNNAGATVSNNAVSVALFSATYGNGHGHGVTKENINRVVSLFSARKLIDTNFIIDKDSYLMPNTDDKRYKEFELDSFIYSLFHSSSNQTALRNIEYNGEKWDVKNEWFWMLKEELSDLVYDNLDDASVSYFDLSEDRYIAKWVKEHYSELSDTARKVLDKANELVKLSFATRKIFNESKPEYQVNNWDCGWYQIKEILKEYHKDEYDEFKTLYKALTDKMRPMVYELGFLKNKIKLLDNDERRELLFKSCPNMKKII